MPPSRGGQLAQQHAEDDAAVQQQSSSALKNARRNFNYLVSPASAGERPARLRTRALLRTCRYISQFIFWRLVRWAKYAAVGAMVAAIGATAFGSVFTGVAWIAAPPTIGASIIAATVWGVGKYVARRMHKRWKTTGRDVGEAERESTDNRPLQREGAYGQDMGPQAVPW